MASIGPNFITITENWTEFKNAASARSLPIQFDEDNESYEIFIVDNPLVWMTRIYKGNVPGALQATYSQAQNDADKADWEANYQPTANAPLSERDPVTGTISLAIADHVDGEKLRYDQHGNVDLPKESDPHTIVYEITQPGVFYCYQFQIDTDNAWIQFEINGQDLVNGQNANGLKLEDLEDQSFGSTNGSYGSYGQGAGEAIGLYQYDPNKWIWKPPKPLRVTSLKVKMKASKNSTSKDILWGLGVRRLA